MIVDFHTHIVPPRIKENRADYAGRDRTFATLNASPKAKLATADELVASMDREEIDVSIALNIAWTEHEMCVETNDYIMESLARYPGRLIGFGAIHPGSTEKAVREIERCAAGDMKGIGEIRPDTQPFPFADKQAMLPVVEAMTQRNMILLTHASEPVGHQYPGKGRVTPDILYGIITAFPHLTIVCAHWGGGLPFFALMPEVAKALKNVYFDTAATPFLYTPAVYENVIHLVGTDRILFGSDYPLMSPGRPLKNIRSLGLPGETERLILSGNACRLLGIKRGLRLR